MAQKHFRQTVSEWDKYVEVGSLAASVPVCDRTTGTTEDVLFEHFLPQLPTYISPLEHFHPVLGASLEIWIIINRGTLPGDSRRKFVKLLDIMQDKYREEELENVVKVQFKVLCNCKYCKNLQARSPQSQLKSAHETQSTQTDFDTHYKQDLNTLLREGDSLFNSLLTIPLSPLQGQPCRVSPLNDGPEEFPDEGNLGAVGGELANSTPRDTDKSREKGPPEREPDADDDSDDDSGSRRGGSTGAAEEMRQLEDEGRCKICLEREIDVVLLPCGHFIICSECAGRVRNCPACREVIQATLAAYRP